MNSLPSLPSLLKVAVAAAGVLSIFLLASCNTVAGVGRDLENAGNALENSASR